MIICHRNFFLLSASHGIGKFPIFFFSSLLSTFLLDRQDKIAFSKFFFISYGKRMRVAKIWKKGEILARY